MDKQNNVCSRDIDKIEGLIKDAVFANSTEITQCNQKAQDHREEVEQYFPAGFLAFVDCPVEQPVHIKASKKQAKTKVILLL